MIDAPILIGAAIAAIVAVLVMRARRAKLESPPQPPIDPGLEGDAAIAAYVQRGRKIEAIKLYREYYGVGLKEAKQAVDRMVARN